MHKTLTTLAAAAAMTLATVAAPDQADARWRGHGGYGYGGYAAGAIIGGLAAGAIIGGIAANRGYYYGSGYYGGPGYYYGPGYYGPGYYGSSFFPGSGPHVGPYAYEVPVYVRPAQRYYRGGYAVQGGCWVETDKDRGYGYYGPCY